MGKPRQSANLVSDNNIFVDVSNDRVGIGSTIPNFKLDVSGDINLSGTLNQNGSPFIASRWTSGSGNDIYRLNGDVGIGTTNPRFTLEVGAVGSSGTSLFVNGDARVTGVLSIGQGTITIDPSDNSIRLSSDTVIRRDNSTGDVRFLDNSGNLKKIIVSEITVGTGITLNGTTGIISATSFYAGGSEITSGGGGSSSPTIYADEAISNDSGWSGNTTYSCCMRTAGGKKGNTFFFARMESNSSASQTRLRVYPFTVNRSTGAITWGSAVNVWLNTSGAAVSTTYFTGPDGTGAVFSGGHNGYPGYGSHVFGYSKFIVNANGTLSDTGYSYTNADHGYNGMFYSLPTSISTGYFSSGGYNANASSLAYFRQHYMNGSSISVGGLTNLSSDTSTSYSVGMIAQPGVYQTGNQVCDLFYYRINSSNYRVRATSANGNYSDHTVSTWDSNAFAFQMTNGDVILYSDAHTPLKFTAYNSSSAMTSAKGAPFGHMYYSTNHFGLGNNEFILSLSSSSPFQFGYPLLKATLDGTTGFTVTGTSTPNYLFSVGFDSSYGGMFPLYANTDDANPDKLLAIRHESSGIKAKVTDFPTFT